MLNWLCWHCLFAYMYPRLDPPPQRARPTAVVFLVVPLSVEQSMQLLRSCFVDERDVRFHRLHSCFGGSRGKRKFLLNNSRKNQWNIIAVLGLCSQHGQLLTVWAQSATLWARSVWGSALLSLVTSLVQRVYLCLFVHICVSWLSSWICSHSSQSCTDRWEHQQYL